MGDEMITVKPSFESCESRCSGCSYRRKPGLVCGARLPHVEPSDDCALDELNAWLLEDAPELALSDQRRWLVQWANLRSADVIKILTEPIATMLALAGDGHAPHHAEYEAQLTEIARVGRAALRMICLDPDEAIRMASQ